MSKKIKLFDPFVDINEEKAITKVATSTQNSQPYSRNSRSTTFERI